LVAAVEKPEKEPSVASLVIAAQMGDHQSLAKLYCRFQGAIEATIRRQLANENDIKEIGQDVSLQASTSLSAIRNPECVGGWLRTIARRLAIQRSTQRARQHLVDPQTITGNPAVEFEAPLDHLIEKERCEALHAALCHLKLPYRQVLKWFYFENCSLEQISEMEQIPVGTVKSRLHTARKILSARLQHLRTA
jgi:RNA polymerase sigma-70 factor (ECF subfamily)